MKHLSKLAALVLGCLLSAGAFAQIANPGTSAIWELEATGKLPSYASPVLVATSTAIGGSAVVAGACTSGTVAVVGSTTAMVVSVTPVTYPGDGLDWAAYVSAAGTVTIKVCNQTAGSLTPVSSTYNVRVTQ